MMTKRRSRNLPVVPIWNEWDKVPEGLALPSARTRQGARLIRRGKPLVPPGARKTELSVLSNNSSWPCLLDTYWQDHLGTTSPVTKPLLSFPFLRASGLTQPFWLMERPLERPRLYLGTLRLRWLREQKGYPKDLLVGLKGLAIDCPDNRPYLRPLQEACLRSYMNLPCGKHALGPEINLPSIGGRGPDSYLP